MSDKHEALLASGLGQWPVVVETRGPYSSGTRALFTPAEDDLKPDIQLTPVTSRKPSTNAGYVLTVDNDYGEQRSTVSQRRLRHQEENWKVKAAVNISFVANIVLFCTNLFVAIRSGSMPMIAASVDSFMDFLSGSIVFVTHAIIRRSDPESYPVGKTRLEPVGIIIFCTIMGSAAVQLILTSAQRLVTGFRDGVVPDLDLSMVNFLMLLGAMLTKLCLFLYCFALRKMNNGVAALAQDHFNDVVAFSFALTAVAITAKWSELWYADPLGGIFMSLYILYSWIQMGLEQVRMLTGMSADQDFIETIVSLASSHHPALQLDIIRAYHFGFNYLVELEVVMPADMPLQQTHDISLELQKSIETLDRVERCFVHVDYERRGYDEHKIPKLTGVEL
eukprot:GILK01008993.1.p1 GENE.GILK01008993.1~~GILK01008993.1.p1  ORF type:complete len:407 (+),score=74.12 GILK01008993.1:47-1222(+)